MTEQSFQEIKKIMQRANYWRSQRLFTKAEIDKWESLVETFSKQGKLISMEAAKLNVEKYKKRYAKADKVFASIIIPNNTLTNTLCQE